MNSKNKSIQIVGVPEHFNLPWHLCIEEGKFSKAGITVNWTDVPEGTGKMCQMLREGSADIAVILSEGIVKDIAAGNPSKIVQVYVKTPLLWGIHVAAQSSFQEVNQLENATVAISRYGSGSHLMSYVNAENQGWNTDKLSFEIVNTLDGAVEALTAGKADYFMWEHFMTKPIVDKGIFRRLADCPTPWPCFVIAVRDAILLEESETVKKILSILNQETLRFKSRTGIETVLAERYSQQTFDILQWLHLTEWSQEQLSKSVLNKIQNQLHSLKIMNKKGTFAEMVMTL